MLQIDQVILCVWSSVNYQGLFADKNREGRCSGVYFGKKRLVNEYFNCQRVDQDVIVTIQLVLIK